MAVCNMNRIRWPTQKYKADNVFHEALCGMRTHPFNKLEIECVDISSVFLSNPISFKTAIVVIVNP